MRARSFFLALLLLAPAVADAQTRVRNASRTTGGTAQADQPQDRFVLGPLLDSLRAAPGHPLRTQFAAAACDDDVAPDPALCGSADAAVAFDTRFQPRPIQESLRVLVDVGALTRDDARAVRMLVAATAPDERRRALGRLTDSASPLAGVVAAEFLAVQAEADAYVSSASEAIETAGTVIGGVLGGASAGAAAGGALGGPPGAIVGAIIGAEVAVIVFEVAVIVDALSEGSSGADRGDDEDEDDEGGPVGQDGEGEGEAGAGEGGGAGGGGPR